MRGRRALSPEVKAIKGNPGKRRLPHKAPRQIPGFKPIAIEPPDFLVGERELKIFRLAAEYLAQHNLVREIDAVMLGRWANYLDRWCINKEFLQGKVTWIKSKSKHGEMVRRHPAFKDIIDLERLLQSIEDRAGMNPTGRQNIIRGVLALPPALGGAFTGEDEKPQAGPVVSTEPAPPESPLGFLQQRRLN